MGQILVSAPEAVSSPPARTKVANPGGESRRPRCSAFSCGGTAGQRADRPPRAKDGAPVAKKTFPIPKNKKKEVGSCSSGYKKGHDTHERHVLASKPAKNLIDVFFFFFCCLFCFFSLSLSEFVPLQIKNGLEDEDE